MANTKSAAKAARQSIKRQARNKSVMSAVRTQVRKAREAIAKGDTAAIDAELKKAVAILDKAASKGTIHARNASRKVARLSAAANGAKAPKA
jgi:small subunit ribosomal protein S20